MYKSIISIKSLIMQVSPLTRNPFISLVPLSDHSYLIWFILLKLVIPSPANTSYSSSPSFLKQSSLPQTSPSFLKLVLPSSS